MKWTYYIIWFAVWFFIFSFLLLPIKPFVAAGGVLMVFVYTFLNGFFLVYGFICINKNDVANTEGEHQLSILDKIFIFCVIAFLILTLFRIFQLMSHDAAHSSVSEAHDYFDDIDPQTGERITPAPQPGFFGPSNYWECILDTVPGTQNDVVGANLIVQCAKKFPKQSLVAEKDKVGGLFSVPTKDDCLMKYAKNTPSSLAAKAIYAACYQLYYSPAE